MTESFEINALRKRSEAGTITPAGTAWLIGYEHGGNHANYVDAYGGERMDEPSEDRRPGTVPEEDFAFYAAGWMQGVEDWEREQRDEV
jgi:hypothetical protein